MDQTNPQAKPVLASVSQLLSQSWKIFEGRISTFLGMSLVSVGALVLTILFVMPFVFVDNPSRNPLFWVVIGLIVLAFIFISIWSQAAFFQAALHEEENIRSAFGKTVSKVSPLFWTSAIVGLIVITGFILLIVPGIIFWVWYSVSGVIVIAEGMNGMAALKKSKEYVKGYGWDVFLRFTAIVVLAVIIQLPTSILGEQSIIGNIYGFVANLVTVPFLTIYEVKLYQNLKALKTVSVELPNTLIEPLT